MACHLIERMATGKKTEEKQNGCRLTQILTVREKENMNPN